ncbi:hypothetical protein BDN72DRAFT_629177 [Pluteus cervinus]|uniref:Uncharacterized protein n=1 Tax=Pluteus cervinus TaxID=181527 RepID=A0ACD3B9L6_9AGAR|nr:hypothetical protein BDN72DRAFT_629177 [Pluteus cervinus]
MSPRPNGLIGSILERKPGAAPSPPSIAASKTGFPIVQHRSQSVFARNKQEARNRPQPSSSSARERKPPAVLSAQTLPGSQPPLSSSQRENDTNSWRKQISEENEQRVLAMTDEEREEERREIFERFGPDVVDILRRAREKRELTPRESAQSEDFIPITDETHTPLASPGVDRVASPPPALSTSSTRPSSRADRRLRFAELSPQDVHVYESAPPSPRRKPLALPPPTDDSDVISLGQWKGKMIELPDDLMPALEPTPAPKDELPPPAVSDPEEGTPEYIRRRYFPDAPANDPNLAWMEIDSPNAESSSATSALRFDLTGAPIPESLSSTLPTHLGLHHHAEGSHAGYTLEDIFILTRSTVPAQRATMLGVLARIARRLGELDSIDDPRMMELRGKEEELRKRIVAAGVHAMNERGSVGAMAIEVVWECIGRWHARQLDETDGVELEVPTDAAIQSVPLDLLTPQIQTLLAQGDAAPESMTQLLAILYRLARQSNTIATKIVETPKLVSSVIQAFLLTPIPPVESSPLPNPLAMDLLNTLVKSSRTNAASILETADFALRFLAMLPTDLGFPLPLAHTLVASTLQFYESLAHYGFYSHIASTAMTPFMRLTQYIINPPHASIPERLMSSWASLLEVWIVCAIDPHRTTPSHEILWSQVVGWGWNEDLWELRTRLSGVSTSTSSSEVGLAVWTTIWRAMAAWLEGSRVNAIKGGAEEREKALQRLKPAFEDGPENRVLNVALEKLQQDLAGFDAASSSLSNKADWYKSVAKNAEVVMSAIRLWLACMTSPSPSVPPSSVSEPPFLLPFPQLSQLCATLVKHELWSSALEGGPSLYPFCRPLTAFLSQYLQLSRYLPGIPQQLWAVQAFSILQRLLPGDEEFARGVVQDLINLITPEWLSSNGFPPFQELSIWKKGGLAVLQPFLENTIQPQEGVHFGPTCLTVQALQHATTYTLPANLKTSGLPLQWDWLLSPLDHLLRSGTSPVFKSLPSSWDSDETEVTTASLLFTLIIRDVLKKFQLNGFVMTAEEVVFNCMKVFMLEHGHESQGIHDSTEEVFRNQVVGQLMDELLQPHRLGVTQGWTRTTNPSGPPSLLPNTSQASRSDLEKVATRFLGGTPFYQFYTDFIALYDAISFSHPTFARLLIPPTSMRYPIDYRRHLWCDFGHVLRTVRMDMGDVVSRNVEEYLWPIEEDPQMLGAYLARVVKEEATGFLRFLAVHHLASSIWSDLGMAGWNEDKARKLILPVLERGTFEVVKEVLRYRQVLPSQSGGRILLAPGCFSAVEQVREMRLQLLENWGEKAMAERFRGVFEA